MQLEIKRKKETERRIRGDQIETERQIKTERQIETEADRNEAVRGAAEKQISTGRQIETRLLEAKRQIETK